MGLNLKSIIEYWLEDNNLAHWSMMSGDEPDKSHFSLLKHYSKCSYAYFIIYDNKVHEFVYSNTIPHGLSLADPHFFEKLKIALITIDEQERTISSNP